MNDAKLQAYQALLNTEQLANLEAAYTEEGCWIGVSSDTTPRTCEGALQLCHRIPPVILGGDSTQTKGMSSSERDCPLHHVAIVEDWLDQVAKSINFSAYPVTFIQRVLMARAFKFDRFTPVLEPTERHTNHFHLGYILEPASAIASIVKGRHLSAEYAVFSDGVTGDLRVLARDNNIVIINAEDKRGLVWTEHELAVLRLLAAGRVPVVGIDENPPPAVRILYQINAQMHKYKTFYAKLFSPCGVMYIRRDAGSCFLQFSKVYRELDGEVHRTACLIIEALNNPRGTQLTSALSLGGLSARLLATWPTRTISAWIRRRALQFFLNMSEMCGAPTLAIGPDNWWSLFHPVHQSHSLSSGIFPDFIAAGASGNVWRSTDGRHVFKIFNNPEAAQTEAKILASCVNCPGLAVPTFKGLFTDGRQYGIVTPYVGKAITTISGADTSQRRQLVQVLRRLHKHGIHHHDVRPANVMVNDAGVLTLIDFDRARWVDSPCANCSDSEVIASMERETIENCNPSLNSNIASFL
ncbi:hypothetical protein C8R43DRAFT_1033237 [Mycena crocata]|nr:hypothetical protein C8R43DRAFT_1033237 [Mycena crocata]